MIKERRNGLGASRFLFGYALHSEANWIFCLHTGSYSKGCGIFSSKLFFVEVRLETSAIIFQRTERKILTLISSGLKKKVMLAFEKSNLCTVRKQEDKARL